MSRASAGFADFFPSAPSVIKQKRSRATKDGQRDTKDFGTQASVPSAGRQPAADGDSIPGGRHSATQLDGGDVAKSEHSSLAQDDPEWISGDRFSGIGSASETSTTSSVFSSSANPTTTMPIANGNQSYNSLTPLTNTELSPPDKPLTPSHVKTNGAPYTHTHAPDSKFNINEETITPCSTPPEPRKQARAEGKCVKGSKITYDPELDKKLSSKDRKKFKPQYKNFGQEVCLNNLLAVYLISGPECGPEFCGLSKADIARLPTGNRATKQGS